LFRTIALTLVSLLPLASTANGEKPAAFIFVPQGAAEPYPVVVWLHGYRGYSPESYTRHATKDECQEHANKIGAAIVGFPATCDLGDGTQQWSEEPVADHAYIQWRLRLLAREHKLDLSNVALVGFSQGAVVAGDLLTVAPGAYRGGLLMSPGCISEPQGAALPSDDHKKLVIISTCGEKEHPGNVELAKAYDSYFRKLGSDCTLKLYPDGEKHDRPADFNEQFPNWMKQILASKEAQPAKPPLGDDGQTSNNED
jgi:predicted esterase